MVYLAWLGETVREAQSSRPRARFHKMNCSNHRSSPWSTRVFLALYRGGAAQVVAQKLSGSLLRARGA